jgi:hypothetical protein
MAFKIIPDEDFRKLYELLTKDSITVLIKESTAREVGLTEEGLDNMTYVCGGDADVWLDLVSSPDHYFIAEAKEQGTI